MAAKVTPTKVRPYKKDTPHRYEDHGDRVRGYVPRNSPYAEKPHRKR